MRNLLIMLICILHSTVFSMAQCVVSGRVVDDKKADLSDVNVLLYAQKDTSHCLGLEVTDIEGHFCFSNVKSGSYLLTMSSLGFEKQKVSFEVAKEKHTSLDTIYLKSASEELGEIVIKADLVNLFGNKESVHFSLTDQSRSASGLELLENMPQVTLDKAKNKLQTIGGGSILILKNGVQIDEVDLMGVRPSDILRVEYISQPPARYANLGVDAVLNVVIKPTIAQSGYLMANLKTGLTTGFGTDIIQGKYSNGNNDFSLRYFLDYRDLNKNQVSQYTEYSLDDGLYKLSKVGKNGEYRGQYHIIQGTFDRVKENNYLLSVKAGLAISPAMENSPQLMSGIMGGVAVADGFSNVYAKSNYLSPKIDIYASKEMKNKQELILNIVATSYNSKTNKSLSESTNGNQYEITTKSNNISNSIITELAYIKEFSTSELSVGSRYFHKSLNEKYSSAISPFVESNSFINNLYAYIDFSGSIKKFFYTIGIGGEQTWLEKEMQNKYFVVKPNLLLSYNFNDRSQLKLQSEIHSFVPDISLLTANPIYLDSAFISRGNPDLKPYYDFANSLLYTYKNSSIYCQVQTSYIYKKNPYYEVFKNQGTYAEKTFENQGYAQVFKNELFFRWKPFDWLTLAPYYSLSFQHSNGNRAAYKYWSHRFTFYASTVYKNWSLNIQAIPPTKSLNGVLISRPNEYYYGDIRWQKNNLSLKLACMFSADQSLVMTCPTVPVQYKETKDWKNFNGLVFLQLTYTLPFGKNVQRSINKRLDNIDNDSGLYIDSKAKL